MAKTCLAGMVELVANLGTRIGHGVGIGHRSHVGKAAMGRGARSGLDGLFVLVAGIPEMHVHIDETRNEILSRTVDDFGTLGHVKLRCDLRDLLALNEDIDDLVKADLRVDRMGSLNQIRHCLLLPEAGTSRPYASKHRH